jgi:ABC-type oligopeptide transport system substrate-binding subunit
VVQTIDPERLRYAVFSSHKYDLAILSWRVSEYPGYLCDWFKDGNPFGYHSNYLQSSCEALNSTGDLTTAQQDVFGIQSTLVHDLPFIPLYSNTTYDAYRSIRYPFTEVQDGLSGIYGAPSLAIPAP